MEGGNRFKEFYFGNYRKFLFVPFIVLIVALSLILIKFQSSGEFINKDISLKGGISLTVFYEKPVNIDEIESSLKQYLSPNDAAIRVLKSAGEQIGFIVESDISEVDKDKLDSILEIIGSSIGEQLSEGDYTFESMGSSLGQSFFNQTIRALIIAFIFMGIVVFLYFRNFVPSLAVILSAFSDIIVTVAIVNLSGIKLGTAGIAALLMLIGYSIDTDIMLTTKVLKRKNQELSEAIASAFKTGMTMTLTTIAAITVALIFTQSEVIRQIMTILLIGLLIDIVNTWIQNSGLLVWYIEKKNKKTV
ncbi:protein translocase subunit SecF [Candidatus Woesearchaeota archaeon]|nr:protein translocase subunit SecF [Candidatus Woesearchaeota archaeon]